MARSIKKEKLDPRYNEVNCYISSINKTDGIIKTVYEELKEQNNSFSLIYFSDHGMVQQVKENGVITVSNNFRSRYHFDIPLFKISSDDTVRKEFKSFKSSINFINGLANWLGIENDKLDKNYSLFDNKDDKDIAGDIELINSISHDDPAIDISKYLIQ